jgi:hypothetical protein
MKIISKVKFTDLTITVDAKTTAEANNQICEIIHKMFNVDNRIDCDGIVEYTLPSMSPEDKYDEYQNAVSVKPVKVKVV